VQKQAPQEWRASTPECATEFLSFVYGQENQISVEANLINSHSSVAVDQVMSEVKVTKRRPPRLSEPPRYLRLFTRREMPQSEVKRVIDKHRVTHSLLHPFTDSFATAARSQNTVSSSGKS
jgi:hypothetical protein